MVTKDMPEATLPHNREAEESLLGALRYGGNVSRMAIEQLKPEDFYLGRHQTIFRHSRSERAHRAECRVPCCRSRISVPAADTSDQTVVGID